MLKVLIKITAKAYHWSMTVVYSHSILVHWGSESYVIYTDLTAWAKWEHIASIFQGKPPQYWQVTRGLDFDIVTPQVEGGQICLWSALGDQGVVTVPLEFVLLSVKGEVMRITPDLARSWTWTNYIYIFHKLFRSFHALMCFVRNHETDILGREIRETGTMLCKSENLENKHVYLHH